jgi:hypothetical protein
LDECAKVLIDTNENDPFPVRAIKSSAKRSFSRSVFWRLAEPPLIPLLDQHFPQSGRQETASGENHTWCKFLLGTKNAEKTGAELSSGMGIATCVQKLIMERAMRLAYILTGLAFVGLATPAAAEEWYIVKEKEGKTCTIVKGKPTVETTVIVDEFGMVYATEVEAQEAMKKTKICTTN